MSNVPVTPRRTLARRQSVWVRKTTRELARRRPDPPRPIFRWECRVMGDVATLIDRIDAEFSGLKDRIARAQAERLQEHRERHDRLRDFERRLESLSDVW